MVGYCCIVIWFRLCFVVCYYCLIVVVLLIEEGCFWYEIIEELNDCVIKGVVKGVICRVFYFFLNFNVVKVLNCLNLKFVICNNFFYFEIFLFVFS